MDAEALRGADLENVPEGRKREAAASSTETEVDVRKGTRAYIGFVELHPTNVDSKVGVIIKHYLNTVRHELGGRAKAMVVTGSRAAAVRYQRAFQKHIEQENLPLKTLVAFSGSLPDPDVSALPGVEVPEVTEIQTFLGSVDLRLSVIAHDMAHWQQIYRERILPLPHVTDIEPLMLVSTIKDRTELPL